MSERLGSKYQREVCVVLQRLRKLKPEFSNRTRLASATKIKDGTIKRVEQCALGKGKYTPTLPIIEAWVTQCGSSIAAFFSEVEAEKAARHKARMPSEEPRIVHGHEHFYKLLTGIIENGKNLWIDSIEGNLYGMYLAGAEGHPLPPGVPEPPIRSPDLYQIMGKRRASST